jgi:hypothetical protein
MHAVTVPSGLQQRWVSHQTILCRGPAPRPTHLLVMRVDWRCRTASSLSRSIFLAVSVMRRKQLARHLVPPGSQLTR